MQLKQIYSKMSDQLQNPIAKW